MWGVTGVCQEDSSIKFLSNQEKGLPVSGHGEPGAGGVQGVVWRLLCLQGGVCVWLSGERLRLPFKCGATGTSVA